MSNSLEFNSRFPWHPTRSVCLASIPILAAHLVRCHVIGEPHAVAVAGLVIAVSAMLTHLYLEHGFQPSHPAPDGVPPPQHEVLKTSAIVVTIIATGHTIAVVVVQHRLESVISDEMLSYASVVTHLVLDRLFRHSS